MRAWIWSAVAGGSGGPPLPQATADQIRARIDAIRRWAISGR